VRCLRAETTEGASAKLRAAIKGLAQGNAERAGYVIQL